MNDRYLFRAKRMNTGEWVEGLLTIMWGQLHIINPNDENTAYPIDESTICQCTGLNDKNGRMIYENDIMVGYLDDMFQDNATYVRVIWHNNGFCTNQNFFDNYELINEFDQNHFVVCGNIFDNPELLEQEG